ncbi:aldehyde dehydrogenase family protein [Conexibacter stalactiti]|uniref:Aldehyde dehydrogenase family protein n=1 Tax=Conexibacter stalactiti TaxID=1940611 RepID=A0ABU4HVS0_9ACTN|nr:aldehyde dehydrogenase family protein [Conexibacter stalactiti]MDW5596164.1 aldehyde dehydrogenase family protein [Conexibacter stalactiti]MEC5036806.1 aldehyde dehydrogenase family protein [Conexibacter stalactiti]
MAEATRRFTSEPRKLLIGGQWRESVSGKTFETFDPATGAVLATVAEGDKQDVDLAVAAARRALDGPWSKLNPSERGRIVHRIGDLIMEHADELAELETLDNGKPKAVAAAADVPLAADLFWYMSGWATKLNGGTISPSVPYMPGAEFHAYTLREPVGVVGQIIPWNFPLLMAAWKLGPALTTGCTVVLKPAEQTPLSALRLAELIQEAGVPDGVVNVIPGFGETAGAALAQHPDVDKVAFTGSTEVGKLIAQQATGNLKRVSLELGGKSPNIVFSDADVDAAIAGAAQGIFFNQGEVCSAGSRLYVQEDQFDRVVEGISNAAASIRVGHGLDPNTEMGPLVSQEQFDRVTRYLSIGEQEGNRVTAGGSAIDGDGWFVQPTVLVDATADSTIVREEVFGPVIAALPFSDVDDLARQANDSAYGLAAGVWTRDISKAHKLAKRIKAGTVHVNSYHVFSAELPFGGYKQSGWGREMGEEVLNNYMETKSVIVGL